MLLPLLLLIAIGVDLVRVVLHGTRFVATRLLLFGWIFAVVELGGLLWMFAVWLITGFGAASSRLVDLTWPVQAWWARTLFTAATRIFDLKFDVRGLESATPGPIVAMFRHASIVDNLLPVVLLQDRLGYRLRWLLKRELLNIPALDVGGTRLPNHFVDRTSTDPRRELRAIRRLAADLGPDEGVLIFPEGTRFTPDRQRRAVADVAERSPELAARAGELRHTMPPRVGGVLALLDTGYDVVVCAHEGLDGFAKIEDILSGGLVGRTITIQLWRIPATEIPADRGERVGWLYATWKTVDDWIDAIRTNAE